MNLKQGHIGHWPVRARASWKRCNLASNLAIGLVLVLALHSITRAQTTLHQSPLATAYDYPSDYREKVLTHTDQTWYLTGETLWYSIFLRDAQSGHLSMLSRVAYLELLDHTGKSAWQAMIRVDSGRGQGSWSIPNTLPTGGYILRSYTRWMRNQPADQYAELPLIIINPQKKPEAAIRGTLQQGGSPVGLPDKQRSAARASLSVETDQIRYGMRTPVTMRISAKGSNGQPIQSSLSVSVVRMADSIGPSTQDDARVSMQTITPAASVRDPNTAFPENAATTGMSDTLSSRSPIQRVQIPEISGPIVTVLAQHKQTGSPVSGAWVCLSIPGKRFQTVIARTGADGRAAFPLGQQEGSGILAFTLLDKQQDSVLLSPESLFDERAVPRSMLPEIPATAVGTMAASMLGEAQLAQAFQQTSRGPMLIRSSSDTTAFYGKPDAEYYLDDYVRFTTMEEVLKEFVREVEVRKNKTESKLRVLNTPMRSFFNEDPLVLLDGVPIRDINIALGIDTRKLRSIAIVSRRFYLGGQVFSGIITLRTYEGDMGGINLPPDILITEFNGLLPPYTFGAPDHSRQTGSRLPDLRRTLWWSPIETSTVSGPSTLRFHTGDVPGKYLISVYASTAEGDLLYHAAYIDVQ